MQRELRALASILLLAVFFLCIVWFLCRKFISGIYVRCIVQEEDDFEVFFIKEVSVSTPHM